MIRITVLTVGKLKEKYLREGCDEYLKRLSAFSKVQGWNCRRAAARQIRLRQRSNGCWSRRATAYWQKFPKALG